jgi:5-methylcytosine-specific restriction endonuclease McrA
MTDFAKKLILRASKQAAKIHQRVLERDEYTCQACGASLDDLPHGMTMRVGFVHRNGTDRFTDQADLKSLCPDCDDGFELIELPPRMHAPALLRELRRATVTDQFEVLKWLMKKYPQGGNSK